MLVGLRKIYGHIHFWLFFFFSSRRRHTRFSRDWSSDVCSSDLGTLNVDTVQEIQVLTSNYLPEYGRSSGGQIRFVTKGGGHDFHGSLYVYVRNDALDANSWSRNASANPLFSKPAPLNYNLLRGTFGG